MSTKKNRPEEDDETTSTSEATTATNDEEANATTEAKETVKVAGPVKKRTVRMLEKHDCHVGGQDYWFSKGEEVVVPEHVARILCGANKAIML